MTPAVCHLPETMETALMYYLMQPVWSTQLLVKNSFQSGTKSWQQSTHNGSCRVTGRIVSQLVPDWFWGQFFGTRSLQLAGIMYFHCEGQRAGRSMPAGSTGLSFLCALVWCQRGAYFSVLFQILLTVQSSIQGQYPPLYPSHLISISSNWTINTCNYFSTETI